MEACLKSGPLTPPPLSAFPEVVHSHNLEAEEFGFFWKKPIYYQDFLPNIFLHCFSAAQVWKNLKP